MVNMFFRLTFSNIQCLSQAFELEQSERAVQVQVLEDGPMAINLSQQVALMLCVLICIARWHGDREPACQCRRHKRRRVDPWVGRSPGVGNGNPLQYSCLENPMDRGTWRATVHGIAEGQTWLSARTHTVWLSTCRTVCLFLSVSSLSSPLNCDDGLWVSSSLTHSASSQGFDICAQGDAPLEEWMGGAEGNVFLCPVWYRVWCHLLT